MASGKARKLKVFQASFGFHESVVAAPSQAAALRAWGSHQNLFADGSAKVTTDAAATEAALSHPETPLRRAIGSDDPFQLEAKSLPKVPQAHKQKIAPAGKPRKAAPPEAPPPDRGELDRAEEHLRALNEKRRREEARFERRLRDLQAEQAEAQRNYVEDKKGAEREVQSARRTYRAAGGRD